MTRLHYHSDTLRLQNLHYRVRDFFCQTFLDLQAAGKHVGYAGEFGDADYVAVGDVADVHLGFKSVNWSLSQLLSFAVVWK